MTRMIGLMLAGVLLPCWAQAPKPPRELTLVLYQQAKAGLSAVPAAVEPEDLLEIANAEDIRHPTLAQADYAQAFRDALALSVGSDPKDPVTRWNRYTKRVVELGVVVRLGHSGQAGWNLAHTLAQQADVPRGQLYTELIGDANDWAQAKAGAAMPLEQGLLARTFGGLGFTPKRLAHPPALTPPYSVMDLAQECYQGDGTFPFLGVLIALTRYHTADTNQRPLVMLAYKRAAEETRPRYQNSAIAVYHWGHSLYPDLDAQLESSAIAMLANLQTALGTPNGQRWASELKANGNALLTLLTQIDDARGEELKAEYSVFSTPAKDLRGPIFKISDLTKNQRQQNADPADALAGDQRMPTLSDQEKQSKFRALVSLAIHLAKAHPATAATAAGDALDLMNDKLLHDNLRRVALLALRMKTNLNEPDKAENLMRQCLDAAEAIAVAKEKAFDAGAPSDQFTLAQDFYGNGAPEVDMWAYASQVDVNLAIARAQQTSAAYFEPLFLERVGVGQEMLHPWWN